MNTNHRIHQLIQIQRHMRMVSPRYCDNGGYDHFNSVDQLMTCHSRHMWSWSLDMTVMYECNTKTQLYRLLSCCVLIFGVYGARSCCAVPFGWRFEYMDNRDDGIILLTRFINTDSIYCAAQKIVRRLLIEKSCTVRGHGILKERQVRMVQHLDQYIKHYIECWRRCH